MLSCTRIGRPLLLSNEICKLRKGESARSKTQRKRKCVLRVSSYRNNYVKRFTSRKKLCKHGDNADQFFLFLHNILLTWSSFLLVYSFDVIGVGESTLFVRVHRVPLLAVRFLPAMLHAVR